MTDRLWWLRYRASKWRYCWRDELAMKVAWLLPARVAYWATIRMGAEATTGEWSHVNATETTLFDVLERTAP